MKITVFGATGMVGTQIIDLALAHGHSVRAFGRNVFEKFPVERERLELFKGALFSHPDVEEALDGTDAVLSALGGGIDGIDKTRSLGMKTIVEAMQQVGPRRIIAIGTTGILKADNTTLRYQMPGYPKAFKAVAIEHLEAWQHLSKSTLDWTLLCPPEIRNAPPTGEYNLRRDYPADGPMHVNAGDLAHFMLHELVENQHVKWRVGIAAKV